MSSSKKRALDVSVVQPVVAAAVDYDGSVAIAQAASDAAVAPEHVLQQQISLEPVTTVMDHDGKIALEPIDGAVPELPHQQVRASQRFKAKATKQQDAAASVNSKSGEAGMACLRSTSRYLSAVMLPS